MTQLLKRSLWISLLSLCLLLFANRSLAHNNFPTLNNSHLDGKVANLEINLRQLQREVSQLRSLRQLPPQSIPRPPAPQPRPRPTTPSSSSNPSTDEQLKNLANLAIELKQDIRQLNQRISQLEQP